MLGKFLRDEYAATAIEYSLIAGFIALAIIAAVGMTGQRLVELFQSLIPAVDAALTRQTRPQADEQIMVAPTCLPGNATSYISVTARSIFDHGRPAISQARTAAPRPRYLTFITGETSSIQNFASPALANQTTDPTHGIIRTFTESGRIPSLNHPAFCIL